MSRGDEESRPSRGCGADVADVTCVIATRDRGARVVQAVESVWANLPVSAEVVIVDQSATGDTEAAVEEFRGRPGFRYVRSRTTGISAGRNAGVELASHELVAFTDDDCLVGGVWLKAITDGFTRDPRVGVVFGAVLAAPTDPQHEVVTSYLPSAPFLARGLEDKHRVEGISACMAIRRSMWRALGGFDEQLGVGAPYRAGEETDLTLRALEAGYFVFETPEAHVTHAGVCPLAAIPAVIDRNWFGTGAAWGKLLRRRPRLATALLARMSLKWAFGTPSIVSSLGARSHRARRLGAFGRGLATGVRHPVDPATGLFVVEERGQPRGASAPGLASGVRKPRDQRLSEDPSSPHSDACSP